MKTNTYKINVKNSIVLLLFTFFGITNLNAQISTSSLAAICPSNACNSQDVKILDVYLADANGDPVPTCDAGTQISVYLWANITSSSKSNLYIQYNLLINDVQQNPPGFKFTESVFDNILIDDSAPIRLAEITYTCGFGIQLTDIYVAWQTPNDNGHPRCATPKCNGETPDIVVPTPLAVDFDYTVCTTGTTAIVSFTSMTTGGDENYIYNWNFDGGIAEPGSSISSENPIVAYNTAGVPYTPSLVVTDGNGTSNLFPKEKIINSFPDEITLVSALVTSEISCNGGSATVEILGDGGTGTLTYTFNGTSNTSGVFTGVLAGLNQPYTITDDNGCEIPGTIDVLDGDDVPPLIAAPTPINIDGCDISAITIGNSRFVYDTDGSADIKATYIDIPNGYTASDDVAITSITYIDVITNVSCPITVTRTFTISDGCNTTNVDQIINIIPPAVTVIYPTNASASACSFADQAAVDSAFQDWLDEFTVANGCSATGDYGTPSAPVLCNGGTTSVDFVVSDLCNPSTVNRTFEVVAPPVVTVMYPTNASASACSFADQAAVDSAFQDWLDEFTVANGCSATGDYGTPSAPVLCNGGTTSVDFVVSDLCNPSTVNRTFEVVAPPAVTVIYPTNASASACSFADQAAVDSAFQDWLDEFTVANGCSATGDYGTPSAPVLCNGGTTSVDFVVSDLCNPSTVNRTFEVVAPPAVTVIYPTNASASACSFADQAAVDSAFQDWLDEFTVANGCSATGDYGTPSAPVLCNGGTTSVDFVVSDLCNPSTVNRTFEVVAPPAVTVIYPTNASASACSFADQAAVDSAFQDWLDEFTVANGCSATGDYGTPSAPVLCNGGTTSVDFVVSDLCNPSTVNRTFEVVAPPAVTVIYPTNASASACSFADQAAVDSAFQDWLDEFTVANGCSATGDYGTPSAPVLCNGGTTSVDFVVSDLCNPSTVNRTFEVVAPPAVTVIYPTNASASACSFADQAAVDSAFQDWLDEFTVANGCSATGDYGTPSAPVLCNGGTTSVDFVVSDLCNPSTVNRTFEVVAPPAVTVIYPTNASASACSFADQAAVDSAFQDWLDEFTVANGCSATGDYGTPSAPVLCNGGTTSVDFVVSDLCNPSTVNRTFEVVAPPAVTISDVQNEIIAAGFYTDQADLDAAFALWLENFTVTGGCSPVGEFAAQYTAPLLCGGNISVIYNVTDLCENGQDVATFTVNTVSQLTISDVQNETIPACTYTTQDDLDAAFVLWLENFTVTGGDEPVGEFADQYEAPSLCGGSVDVVFNVTDLCATGQDIATFSVTAPDTLVISDIQNETIDACTYTTQDDLDAAFTLWLENFTVSGGCDPSGVFAAEYSAPSLCGGSVDVVYNVTDLCENGQDIATFSVTTPDALVVSDIQNETFEACTYMTQEDLDAAFTLWLENFTVSGGCDPSGVFADQYNAPSLCGGSVDVVYNVTDLCENGQDIATFSVTAPEALVISDVLDEIIEAGFYTDQADLDAAFALWLENFTVSGGCSPEGLFAAEYNAPLLCGGSVDVVYNVTDLCENGLDIATFTVETVNQLTISDVQNETIDACTYTTQEDLDTAFTLWLENFTVTGGDEPIGEFAEQYSAPSLCGGSVDIVYNVTDLCASGQDLATFTVTAPDTLVVSDIQNETIEACTYTTQDDLDAAFTLWLENFTVSGGCDPSGVFAAEYSAPSLCGGSVDVVYNVTDLCENGQDIATFSVTTPDALVVSDIQNETFEACTYMTQEDLDAAFTLWLENFTVSGGCDPSGVFAAEYSAPSLCGGSVDVVYNVTDLCENGQDIATFSVTTPDALVVSDIQNETFEACTYMTQEDLDAAFTLWLENFTVSGGCDPSGVFAAEYSAPSLCGGSVDVVYNVTDLCENGQDIATFSITTPDALVVSDVQDLTVSVCDYADQAALDAAFASWITEFSVSGGCSPQATDISNLTAPVLCDGGTVSVTYDVTDLCQNGQDTATFTLTLPSALAFDQNTLPVDATVECHLVPVAETLTASNGCGDVTVNYSEGREDGECPNSYVLTRSWDATDDCGNPISHVQKIIVEDTEAPQLVTTLQTSLSASCSAIPEAPEPGFADNCSESVSVIFTEEFMYETNTTQDYEIVRTWTVTDDCNNTAVFKQIVTVTADEFVSPVDDRACIDDGTIDLNSYLSEVEDDQNWTVISGDTTLNGSIFDPANVELGDYTFSYTNTSETGCLETTELTIEIHDECIVIPCGSEDVVISKAVTPNGDAYNQSFDITGVDDCNFEANVKIFNRWGALIFESDSYTVGENQGDWNGQAHRSSIGSSSTVPNGTYYYIITLKESGLEPFTGPVYVGTK